MKIEQDHDSIVEEKSTSSSNPSVEGGGGEVHEGCGVGNKNMKTANKRSTEAQGEESSESNAQATSWRTRNQPAYEDRKVVRLPREVFDYMARIDEDGTVRFNITQLSLFFMNEIIEKFVLVRAENWDKESIPLMDISIPPTAKQYPSLLVQDFSNEPTRRIAEEKRLQNSLGIRMKLQEKQKSFDSEVVPETKCAEPSHSCEDANDRATESEKEVPQNGDERKPEYTVIKESPKKKRDAERNSKPSTPEGDPAAKQLRLDEEKPAQLKVAEKLPRKYVHSTYEKTGASSGAAGPSKSTTKGGSVQNRNPWVRPATYPRSRPTPFAFPLQMRGERQSGSAPFQNQRYMQGNTHEEQMRCGRTDAFNNRKGGSELSPWTRPADQPENVDKLVSLIRRATQELRTRSSFETVRKTEKMGLGSFMGAVLNSMDHKGTRYPAFGSASNQMIAEDCGNPLIRPSQPRSECITYPTMGRGATVGGGRNAATPPFGQLYPAFADQSWRNGGLQKRPYPRPT
uniref:HTH La-type RNA-binding domain-containing protein n=1 Tax=Haemonchus contortus TaxID=6289 RepID=A0A7I5E8W0_HAECO